MKKLFKKYFEKLDENAVIVGFTIITAIISYFASMTNNPAIQMLSVKMMNLSLVTLFTGIYFMFLYTTKFDIRKEILEENNMACALYAGLVYLGNCLVVTLNN